MRTPLDDQVIDATDSMFGKFAEFGDLRAVNIRTGVGRGLDPKYSYINLIKKSFDPRYWADARKWRIVNGKLVADPVNGYTQLELNFSMFWGISIMLYEATLISDDSPFDRFFDNGAFSPVPGFGDAEIRGLGVFSNEGGCIHCHTGPVLSGPAVGIKSPFTTTASTTSVSGRPGTIPASAASIRSATRSPSPGNSSPARSSRSPTIIRSIPASG